MQPQAGPGARFRTAAYGGGVVAQQVPVMALMINTVLTLLANICHPRKEKCEPKVM